MLWLFIIFLIGVLSFVIFHKPHVNSAGVGWTPPAKRSGAAEAGEGGAEDVATLRMQREATGSDPTEDAVTLRLQREPAPRTPDTLDFNDLLGGRRQGTGDRPSA